MKRIAMFVTLLAVMIIVGGCVEYTATKETTAPTTIPETKETAATTTAAGGTGETASTASASSSSSSKDYDGDELQRIRDAAFDPDAKSFISAQINYMYPSQDDGSRKMGDVFAYYGMMDISENNSKAYAKAFIEKYMPGLKDLLAEAEDIQEDGTYALGITTDTESFVFWPDENLQGITVIYSANSGESAENLAESEAAETEAAE